MERWTERTTSGKFKARVRLGDGRTVSRTFTTKRAAKEWLHTQGQNAARGVLPSSGKATFEALANAWLTEVSSTLAPGTLSSRRSMLSAHLLPDFGDRRVTSITRSDVVAWSAAKRDGELSPGHVRNLMSLLGQVLRYGVETGVLTAVPTDRVARPSSKRHQLNLLTVDQVLDLSEAIEPRFKALILVAGFGGLRISELVGLRLGNVDWPRGTIRVVEATTMVNGHRIDGTTKTAAGRRSVRMPSQVMEALKVHVDTYPRTRDGRVFSSARGLVIRAPHFNAGPFARACEKAGLPHMRFHDLRHSAVSFWIASGASPKLVQVKAGHSSISVTFDTYGHLFEDADDKATASMEDLLARRERDANVIPLKRRS